jgi:hypothetical protein
MVKTVPSAEFVQSDLVTSFRSAIDDNPDVIAASAALPSFPAAIPVSTINEAREVHFEPIRNILPAIIPRVAKCVDISKLDFKTLNKQASE